MSSPSLTLKTNELLGLMLVEWLSMSIFQLELMKMIVVMANLNWFLKLLMVASS